MKLNSSFQGGRLTLSLTGELDHHAAREAMQRIGREIDLNLPRECVLDLDKLTFTDSSGIAVILGTQKRMGQVEGKLLVINVHKQPMKVFKAAGIGRIAEIREAG